MRDLTDEQLIINYADGDSGAFETLYARHRLSLMRYLKRQLGSEMLAEEVFQEVWIKVINARERYRSKASFRTWLFRIAHNAMVDSYRKQKCRVPEATEEARSKAEELPDRVNEPERQLTARNKVHTLLKLIGELPEDQRESFLLKEEGGLSLDEIAEVTGASREAAKSRLRYALDKLRRGLEAVYG